MCFGCTDWPTSAPGTFLFSLRNNDDELGPFKVPLRNENEMRAIYCRNSYGPCFGLQILCIRDNAGLTNTSKAQLGYRYRFPPGYASLEPNTKSLLAGSELFTPSEVEVLYLN